MTIFGEGSAVLPVSARNMPKLPESLGKKYDPPTSGNRPDGVYTL